MKPYPRERRRPRLALALACLALSPVAFAATFGELYTVTVEPNAEIQDQSARRSDAIRRGMVVLLTRITGRQQAAAYPEMRSLIDNAERVYFAGYDFLSPTEARVTFNRFQVESALERLNLPLFGEERPLTLLWIATDLGDGRRAELKADDQVRSLRPGAVAGVASEPLSDEDAEFFDGIVEEILTAADERGLPLVLPELDARDRRQVRFADVWGGFDRFVKLAAERYAVDAILIARIVTTELGLEVEWTALRGDRREMLTTPRARMGIDWLADEFASELTTVGGARLTWITIRGLRTWDDLRAIEYLDSISLIESYTPDSIDGDEYVLRVAARGDDDQLRRVIGLGNVLVPVENAVGLVYVPSWRAELETVETLESP